MEREWYIIDNGVQRGPMPASELRNCGLTSASMVWTQGMSDWKPAGECDELRVMLNGGGVPPTNDATKNWGANEGMYGAAQQPAQPGYGQQPYNQPGYGGNAYGPQTPYNNGAGSGKSNIAAGLLAIFVGCLGIQYFYIGKVSAGLITILLSIVTCGAWELVTLIQGIYMLTLNQEQFDAKYVYSTSSFPIL